MDTFTRRRGGAEESRPRPLRVYDDAPDAANLISGQAVDCALHVHKELGPGYTEDVYEEALCLEMLSRGIIFERQKLFGLSYKGKSLSKNFRTDVIVQNTVLMELKAVEAVHPVHRAQILSYLKVTGLPIGLLVNFNVPLIKNGIERFINKNSVSPRLRVQEDPQECSKGSIIS
jgi:GxxExxY protein